MDDARPRFSRDVKTAGTHGTDCLSLQTLVSTAPARCPFLCNFLLDKQKKVFQITKVKLESIEVSNLKRPLIVKAQSRRQAVTPTNRVREDGGGVWQIFLRVKNHLREMRQPKFFDVGAASDFSGLSKGHVSVIRRLLRLLIFAVSRLANHQIRVLRRLD